MDSEQEWYQLRIGLSPSNFELDPGNFNHHFIKRAVNLLGASNVGDADLAIAIRDALRSAGEIFNRPMSLPVAGRLSLINVSDYGLRVTGQNVALSSPEINRELKDTYALSKRRFLHDATMDLALAKKLKGEDFETYFGGGQQLAVRAALMARPDRSIIINLPTGCGKTLVAHALIAFSGNSEITLVIVPTTALAIQQGDRVKSILQTLNCDHGGPYCWHFGLREDQKNLVKQRIKEGSQKVIFSSPESVYGALYNSLTKASEQGSLKNIIIDEAHYIEQWGSDFRPEFQILSAVLKRLAAANKDGIKKVFMSATFRQSCVNLLQTLFPDPTGAPLIVNESFLRPEPTYEVLKADSLSEHENLVKRQIVDLPRPMIVYCSTHEEIDTWREILPQMRFKRFGVFDGRLKSEDKKRIIIHQWDNDEIDIMVATKAFGVGMDKGNIRSVLRLSVPENVDLFYQEAGRAGRDGKACNVRLVYCDEQRSTARHLNREKLIKDQAFPHWEVMWKEKKSLGSSRYRINLNAIHQGNRDQTALNWEWNWKTLLLMQRAGMLKTELDHESKESSGLSGRISKFIIVSGLRDGISQESVFLEHFLPEREREILSNNEGYEKLVNWLENFKEQRLCDLLEDFYTIAGKPPEVACGGCPACRQENRPPNTPTLADSRYSHARNFSESSTSGNIINIDSKYMVYFLGNAPPREHIKRWQTWITKLIDNGAVNSVRLTQELHDCFAEQLPPGLGKFWVTLKPSDPVSDFVELIFLFAPADLNNALLISERKGIICGDTKIRCLKNPRKAWWETRPNRLSLGNFLNKMQLH